MDIIKFRWRTREKRLNIGGGDKVNGISGGGLGGLSLSQFDHLSPLYSIQNMEISSSFKVAGACFLREEDF